MFTRKPHAGLKFHFGQNDWYEFHFGQNDRYEIHTVLSFISPQFMWTQVKSWLNTGVRFSTEIKSYTDLSSFRLLCERTLSLGSVKGYFTRWVLNVPFDQKKKILQLVVRSRRIDRNSQTWINVAKVYFLSNLWL